MDLSILQSYQDSLVYKTFFSFIVPVSYAIRNIYCQWTPVTLQQSEKR